MDTETAPEVLYSKANKLKPLYLVIAGVLILIGACATAFLLGQKYSSKVPGNTNLNVQGPTAPASDAQAFFENQSAVINGSITQNQNGTLTIVNTDNETSTFPLSPMVTIYKQIPGQQTAQTTSDLNAIELNKKAVITLSAQNGQYMVSGISYLTPPPPPPTTTQQ